MSESRMPIGSQLIFPDYFGASNTEVSGADSIDSMFCTEGVGTPDGPWYVMLRAESYGPLPVLPFPTALPVKGQPTTGSLWVSVNWLIGIGLLPPLQHSYFVAPNGPGLPLSDGSVARPFKTIQEGINTVPSGSALVIAANVYREALVLPDSKSLEFWGLGGPVTIQPLTEDPALSYTATALGSTIRIGLYHIRLITSGTEEAATPTVDLNFDALIGNTAGTVVMNDVDITRIGGPTRALQIRKANNVSLVDLRVDAGVSSNRSLFLNCGTMYVDNCQLGPVTESYDATQPEPLSVHAVHRYISTLLGSSGGEFPESLLLSGSPNVDFDEDCVLTGPINTTLLGFTAPNSEMMPIIRFHGKAGSAVLTLPDKAAALQSDSIVDLDRSQWTRSGLTIDKPVVAVSAANTAVSARQMNFNDPGAGNHLAINSNLSVDARGLTGFIELVLPGTATVCDRDRASCGSFGAPPPAGLPTTTPAVYLDDFLGNALPFPLGANIMVVGEVFTSVAPGGAPLLAAPYAIGSKTNAGFAFGFNAADSAAITGSDWIGIRFGA